MTFFLFQQKTLPVFPSSSQTQLRVLNLENNYLAVTIPPNEPFTIGPNQVEYIEGTGFHISGLIYNVTHKCNMMISLNCYFHYIGTVVPLKPSV